MSVARPDPSRRPSTRNDANVGWSVFSTLISGLVVWGGIGWLLDRWLGTSFLLPVGALLGIGLALYLVYAKLQHGPSGAGDERSRQ